MCSDKQIIKAGVIGYPISHSLSPVIHNFWLDKLEIKGSYELLEVKPDDFEKFVNNLIEKGYSGFNVTVPFKETAFKMVDKLTPQAKKIGAVNTVIIGKDKKLTGHNTDSYGFIENIKQSIENFDFIGKKVLILGAGGASKAVISGLLDEKVEHIYLSNRTFDRAKNQEQKKVTALKWEEKEDILKDIDILINTTTQGMKGQGVLQISLKNLPKEALVTDIVYNPLDTKLLIDAKNNKNTTVNGIGMLLYQAAEGFESWFGKKPTVNDELKSKVLENC